ncbi:hypothetical protein SGPA1_21937 [Streptomyces misionensis JCM 4497]
MPAVQRPLSLSPQSLSPPREPLGTGLRTAPGDPDFPRTGAVSHTPLPYPLARRRP